MKNLIARIVTAILLVFGASCAGNFVLSAISPTPVYAVPGNPLNDWLDLEDEDDTTDNSEQGNTSDGQPTDGTVEETPDSQTPENTENTENSENTPESDELTNEERKNACNDQTGALSWIVCPTSGVIAGAVDALYNAIEEMLVVSPISMEDNSPVYLVWQYLRNLTNIAFIICLLIIIYSQLTGLGIQNYGVKRMLPRLIISVILVNLSFIICMIVVDASNIIGSSLREFLSGIQDTVLSKSATSGATLNFSLSDFLATIISGGTIAGFAIGVSGGAGYLFFMLLVMLIGALVAVVSGLITIAARQALVALLIMISPLAFVAYLLPNTEKWFGKWKEALTKMMVFYPMFSFLFGASQLIGYTLILAALEAGSAIGVIIGIAVEILPLFLAWSLMKMSGTVLAAINSGVRKVAAPLQRGLAGADASVAEQRRQNYLANSNAPGAKMRRYLDYRQSLRDLDTKNNADARKNMAMTRAYNKASSSRGHDTAGNLSWDPVANRYTVNAKRAALAQTRAGTAEAAYKNTLNSYGRNFAGSAAAGRLANAHAEAYKDAMAQQYLTANEAQADQEFLLNSYINAQVNAKTKPYEYNRLVKSAAGSLGHTGESSIMGQVIVGNSAIESRRRTEGRIMINKFGIDKLGFRGMVFDCDHINDEGLETDKNGKVVQDIMYNMLPNEKHTPWQQYIGVHKTSGAEITKEEYDRLSDTDRTQYRRVKYFDIKDDNGQTVQRVYDDDAGYMKEILNDDILVGDPINRRYNTEIGVAHAKGEKTGILRKYHSTISTALKTSGYKDHSADMTPMITAQSNMGFITSPGQHNIASLQSLNVASKAGPFLQNDPIFIKNWTAMIASINPTSKNYKPDLFSFYFPDQDILTYRNVNGQHLKGLRLKKDEDGNMSWYEVGHAEMEQLSDEEALELRKNFLKHDIIPKTIKKFFSNTNRKFTPNIMESQKPDTLIALDNLVTELFSISDFNNDETVNFADRPKPDLNFDKLGDQTILQRRFKQRLRELGYDEKGNKMNTDTSGSNTSDTQSTSTKSGKNGGGNSGNGGNGRNGGNNASGSRQGTSTLIDQITRSQKADENYASRNNISNCVADLTEIFDDAIAQEIDLEVVQEDVLSYFNETEALQNLVDACQNIFDMHAMDRPGSLEEAMHNMANTAEQNRIILEQIKGEVINLVQSAYRD